jgi:hypothetical protein
LAARRHRRNRHIARAIDDPHFFVGRVRDRDAMRCRIFRDPVDEAGAAGIDIVGVSRTTVRRVFRSPA